MPSELQTSLRAILENTFNHKRLDYQPWNYFLRPGQVDPDMEMEQRVVQEMLSDLCGATFSGRCFVSAHANVFTERLHMDENAWIAAGAIVRGDVQLGYGTSINPYAHVAGMVRMGSHVMVAGGAAIYGFDHGHTQLDTPIYFQPLTVSGIEIEDDCWIGANAVVVDGVRLGAHSIVAAGAVVKDSFAPHSIVGGVPARLIRLRGKTNDRRQHDRRAVDKLSRDDGAAG
jgi:acetyltransferase-like isoleucine patch superfamily enzyme